MEVLVFDVDYEIENNQPVLRLFCKDKDGNTVLVKYKKFLPYFYVLPKTGKIDVLKRKIEELRRSEVEILKIEKVKKIWKNDEVELIKIVVNNPRKIPLVRDAVKNWEEVEDTFEYDIPFYKRFLMDYQIEPMNWIKIEGKVINNQFTKIIEAEKIEKSNLKIKPKFKILAFDTEFIEEDGESKLIMLSLICNNGLKKVITSYDWKDKPEYVESVSNERKIIERFVEIVKKEDVDLILGYNSDRFDFLKLRERAEKYKIKLSLGRNGENIRIVRRGRIPSFKIKGRVHIDLFDFIEHILAASLRSEVLTLDEVAQELLGMKKKEMEYEEMVEIWSKKVELKKLVEYSLWDSELVLKLGEIILPQIFAICKLIGHIPFDVSRYTYSQIVESFLMRKAIIDKVLIPNHPKHEELQKRRLAPIYKGAIVIEPKKGIHSNVLVFDFKSLYPTIIVTHNIDPWTINCEHNNCKHNKPPEVKNYFCKIKKGFIPKNLEEVIIKRKEIKKKIKKVKKDSEEHILLNNMQYALKIIANATYGYFGFFGARWYNRACGEATAAWGRYYIKKVIEFAKEKNFEIIYGDTDSLMIRVPFEEKFEKIKEIGKKFVEEVNKKLPGIIELEFRGLYEGGIFVAREKGEVGAKKRYALIDYEGNLEIRGFETVRRDWCELAKRIQRDVLTTVLKEKDPEKAVQLVRDTIKKLKDGKIEFKDLIIYEQITRPLSQYEQLGPHVKAAMKLKEKGFPVGEGMVIGFIITKGSGSISDRAMPIELVKPKDYDPSYYIHHQILPASFRVLKALGYSKEEIISGKVQKKLKGFFK